VLKICKLLIFTFALALCFGTSYAQTLSVTATITDSDAQVWTGMRWSVALYSPSNGTPFYNGTPLSTATQSGIGNVSVILNNTNTITPIGSQYLWTLCSNTSGPCSQFLSPVNVANMSATLSALVTVPRFSGISGAYGYADVELTNTSTIGAAYYNVTNNALRISNGSTFSLIGGGATLGTNSFTGNQTVNSSTVTTVTNGTLNVIDNEVLQTRSTPATFYCPNANSSYCQIIFGQSSNAYDSMVMSFVRYSPNNPTNNVTFGLFNSASIALTIGGAGITTPLLATTTQTAIASATTIAPTNGLFHVTGTIAIATITIPYASYTGCINIIPDGVFTTTTAGNIALASVAVVSKQLQLCYDGTKWYPSY